MWSGLIARLFLFVRCWFVCDVLLEECQTNNITIVRQAGIYGNLKMLLGNGGTACGKKLLVVN